jgi:hypothetical protein
MADPKIKLNFRQLGDAALRSPAVAAALRAEAERLAGRARAFTAEDITVVEGGGRVRKRVALVRSAAGEAHDRALGRAIGSS